MSNQGMSYEILVSIIMPIYNTSAFLSEAFQSIIEQTWKTSLEVSLFCDACTDDSLELCYQWKQKFIDNDIKVVIGKNPTNNCGGVGYSKNQAIQQSHGKYLCFLDSDDIMMPARIQMQLELAENDHLLLVGSQYIRTPECSTKRYTLWSNSLTDDQLYCQIYTSFGPTIINPTWFCSRKVIENAGPFLERVKGFPEDLEFFYRHLLRGGRLVKINQPLLIYRYHICGASFSVHEDTIWNLRLKQLEANVLSKWEYFTIWNAGKQGRKFFRTLSEENKHKVKALCDVDSKKINKGFYKCEVVGSDGKKMTIPIVHFKAAKPPFVICVKINLTNGEFEENLKSLNLIEGNDYFHFS
ncbi:queuosine-tRNA galactosyltransferase-like [Hydra vulgaris]|uniref:Queuosine-tRNA galactosyltransferase-like n=1 Tax=Hydra vulgaris TaxID=6087 RepID=A0ABM4B875_HYDVU